MHPSAFSALLAILTVLPGTMGSACAAGVVRTNLTSDGAVTAPIHDPNLVNPWGMSFAPSGPFWVSDNGTGLTTVYGSVGQIFSLVVTIPPAKGKTGPSAPTGQVYNPTSSFAIKKGAQTGVPSFIFATEDGTISGWAPSIDASNAINAVDRSTATPAAVYKGLALATRPSGNILLAANFASGVVEIYNSHYQLIKSHRSANVPADFSPFNVQVLGDKIFITYAKHLPGSKDDIPGPGNGAIEALNINTLTGKLLTDKGDLNSPWGLAIAPTSFKPVAGHLLVGNFGDGRIHAFNLKTGIESHTLTTPAGVPLRIDGLWGLIVGNGGSGGDPTKVYFTAGPLKEAHGVFGSLKYKP